VRHLLDRADRGRESYCFQRRGHAEGAAAGGVPLARGAGAQFAMRGLEGWMLFAQARPESRAISPELDISTSFT
jgi:hypothetical protein